MAFVETYRAVVAPSDCDVLGHMNVSRYFAACSDGILCLQTHLGLGASNILSGRQLSFAVIRAESDFKSEVTAGECIVLESTVEKIGTKTIDFRHRLRRLETGQVAFETLFRCALLDLKTRRATAVTEDIAEKAATFLVDAN